MPEASPGWRLRQGAKGSCKRCTASADEGMKSFLEAGAHLPTRSFEKDDVIMHEERKDGAIYILKSGAVEIQKRQTSVTTIASPGVVFGEVSVLLDRPHTVTVIALEPCEFHVAADGEQFLRDHPELNMEVTQMLAHRLQRVTEQLVDLQERIDAGLETEEVSGLFRSLVEYHHF